MFVEKLFYKWLLWKLKKNANQEYLSIKEREEIKRSGRQDMGIYHAT